MLDHLVPTTSYEVWRRVPGVDVRLVQTFSDPDTAQAKADEWAADLTGAEFFVMVANTTRYSLR